ncbi:PEP/pyruvate-binding domain-containing protein [Streptomyces formicae]|uniref:Phosphoenolpyruvate synthase n=1 Tax=Streptomyces formicae TaxID=1616117 RepID=A0A291Q5D9_9ACTN|nr:PEP/pyruvate-binding domain-containing protein [Streptomyces formicae]ATL26929.1 Phosphoenolpyruvate synthase [Streptomyces formicae]
MTTLDERPAFRPARPAPAVLRLDDARAALVPLTGSKAARLARAARAGLPVLPGFVVPRGGSQDAGGDDRLRPAWRELSRDGALPLVVRSSSPQEDTQESSLAGHFTSVLDVRGWTEFRAAVRTVVASARRPDGTVAPMAVLVQPMLAARVGGVLFGADPVAGRSDRMLVSAVRGGPETLVGGEQAGTNHWLSRGGRLLRTEPPGAESPDTDPSGTDLPSDGPPGPGPLLTPAELRRLARLARRARRVFGGPQDIEFGFDEASGRLWLFQSRPITALAARPPRGARLLGPGPVAETLPDQLEPLEEDLWIAPMARGLAAALDIGASAPRRTLRGTPVVTSVGGRAAADLRLLGAAPPAHPWLALLNPAPGARRLAAAWRVGRLSTALPGLALDLCADIDRALAETPPPAELPPPALAATLRWTRAALVPLHAQEALCGALLTESSTATAAGAALGALARGRAHGLPDHRITATDPVVLALVPPSLRDDVRLPEQAVGAAELAPPPPVGSLPPREALRLRVRWTQELQVRLVREAGRRLAARGAALGGADRVGLLRWGELMDALAGGPLPGDFGERLPGSASAPLPDAFRLTDGGTVVAERPTRHDGDEGDGRGVSGGRAAGIAWHGTGVRPPDAVLVVRTLDPALAPLLPGLAGLIAQTGSPLSHLALLAREFGLPAVVGVPDAVRRVPPGSSLTLDGTTGEVRLDGVRLARAEAPLTDTAARPEAER